MHLQQIRIENLLSFNDAEFSLGAYTIIVGPNNAGKTNLLRILDMISKSENLELLQINRKHRLDPENWSRVTLTLRLDDSEAMMAFQCIFGQTEPLNVVPKIKTIKVMIFWDKQQVEMSTPKFVAYIFDDNFIIHSTQSNTNSLFYSRSLLSGMGGIGAAGPWEILTPELISKIFGHGSNTLQYTEFADKKSSLIYRMLWSRYIANHIFRSTKIDLEIGIHIRYFETLAGYAQPELWY